MGLDMYLEGKKYLWKNYDVPDAQPKEDGFDLKEKVLRLGYWRKHPNLHGFIVNKFAGGKDECQEIELSIADLQKVINAVEAKELPETSGFFFGKSYGDSVTENDELDRQTIETIQNAIKWLHDVPKGVESRSVVYQSSW